MEHQENVLEKKIEKYSIRLFFPNAPNDTAIDSIKDILIASYLQKISTNSEIRTIADTKELV